jgi:hypothetical protein
MIVPRLVQRVLSGGDEHTGALVMLDAIRSGLKLEKHMNAELDILGREGMKACFYCVRAVFFT